MSNTVKLIIDQSPIAKWRPGLMFNWAIRETELTPGDGKVAVKVQVVIGNAQYRNGKRLTLYVEPDLPTIDPIPE